VLGGTLAQDQAGILRPSRSLANIVLKAANGVVFYAFGKRPTLRNTLRQALRQLHGLRQTRRYRHMAHIVIRHY